jgi:large subunit ribosomal protein L7/L12
MVTQEQVVQALGNMTVMELIKLTKDLEQKWGVEAKPQVVQQATTQQTTETQTQAQVSFSVVLQSVPAEKKISVIKTVRELLGLTLLDSKALLDALPKTIKEELTKEEADELKRKLTEAGAVMEVK